MQQFQIDTYTPSVDLTFDKDIYNKQVIEPKANRYFFIKDL